MCWLRERGERYYRLTHKLSCPILVCAILLVGLFARQSIALHIESYNPHGCYQMAPVSILAGRGMMYRHGPSSLEGVNRALACPL